MTESFSEEDKRMAEWAKHQAAICIHRMRSDWSISWTGDADRDIDLFSKILQEAYESGKRQAEEAHAKLQEIYGPTYAQRTEALVRASRDAHHWLACNMINVDSIGTPPIIPVREVVFHLTKALEEFGEKE